MSQITKQITNVGKPLDQLETFFEGVFPDLFCCEIEKIYGNDERVPAYLDLIRTKHA